MSESNKVKVEIELTEESFKTFKTLSDAINMSVEEHLALTLETTAKDVKKMYKVFSVLGD